MEDILYQVRANPNENKFSIFLNKIMDQWPGEATEVEKLRKEKDQQPQYFYEEGEVMIRQNDKLLIYGVTLTLTRDTKKKTCSSTF